MDHYRLLAQKVIEADPTNRILAVCVGSGGHSSSDFVTDLASYLLAAANAGLIKVKVRG